jgi:hypothetical protein
MKANIVDLSKHYSSIPQAWGAIFNYHLDIERHFSDGWRDVVTPDYNPATQKLSDNWELVDDIVTKQVIDLTADEIEAIENAKIPMRLKNFQIREGLIEMGIMPSLVDAEIEKLPSPDKDIVSQMWNFRDEISRNNPYVIQLAEALNIDLKQLYTISNLIN